MCNDIVEKGCQGMFRNSEFNLTEAYAHKRGL